MDLRSRLIALTRPALAIVVVPILFMSLTLVATAQAAPSYASSARLFVASGASDGGDSPDASLPRQAAAATVDSIQSQALAADVRDSLGLDVSLGDLLEQVSAAVVSDTVMVEVSVVDHDPERARALAQAFAERLVASAPDVLAPATAAGVRLLIVDDAYLPRSPVSPRPLFNLALAGLLGVAFDLVGVVIWRRRAASRPPDGDSAL